METREERPRAYYPHGTDSGPAIARTPGWDTGPDRRIDDGASLARALGWFSIGLGLLEVAAPERVTGFLGVDDGRENLVRLMGLRELAHGVAILSDPTSAAGVWSRVGGDAADLAALGLVLSDDGADRDRVGMAAAMVAGVTALDLVAARKLSGPSAGNGGDR